MQTELMKFDPATGEERPYPSHSAQWRNWHGVAAWLFDPWTGKRRNAYDVGSDVHGLLIVPAGTLGGDTGGGASKQNKHEAENERLREDAERYRWLRGDACPDPSVRWTQWEVRCWRSPVWSYDLRRQELDQAIDDARAAEEKKG